MKKTELDAEESAERHADMRCPEQGPEFIVWCMCRDDFLAGIAWRDANPKQEHKDMAAENEHLHDLIWK